MDGRAPCDCCTGKGYSLNECQTKERGVGDSVGSFDDNGDWYENIEGEGEGA